MKNFHKYILMNKKGDADAGGSEATSQDGDVTGNTDNEDFYNEPEAGSSDESAKGDKGANKESASGYGEDDDEESNASGDEAKKTDAKKDDKKVESASGYEEKEPEAPKPPEKKPEEKPAEGDKDEFKLEAEGLEKPIVEKITEIAKKHKLTPEQAKAMVEYEKEVAALDKKAYDENQVLIQQKAIEIKKAWHKDLKNDPEFGGEKFSHSLQKCDKVLNDFFPGLKKVLTENKKMLPPYAMKDLAKLADHLYKGDSLVYGDEPNQDDGGEDHLDFYNS